MGQVRVVVTRIEPDGAMHRRMVETAQQSDPCKWEDPGRPRPGGPAALPPDSGYRRLSPERG